MMLALAYVLSSLPLQGEGQGGGMQAMIVRTHAPLPTSPLKGGGGMQ